MKKIYTLCSFILLALSTVSVAQVNSHMAGSWTQYDSCGGFSHGNTTTVTIVANVASKTDITINNFGSLAPPYDATATLDSTTNTVTVPNQTAGLVNLAGSGTYGVHYGSMTIAWVAYTTPSTSCVDTYSRSALGVYNIEEDMTLTMWPNPVAGYLHYTMDSQIPNGQVKIYNMYGECVYQRSVNVSEYKTEQIINTQALASGLYILQVENGKYLTSMKFIKQ